MKKKEPSERDGQTESEKGGEKKQIINLELKIDPKCDRFSITRPDASKSIEKLNKSPFEICTFYY